MVAIPISRAGLRRVGAFDGVTSRGLSVVGVYRVWKHHGLPLAEAILRTRALGFDVSLTSVYDDAVVDGWKPAEIRAIIVTAVLEVDGPELAAAIGGLLIVAELMRCPA